MTFLPPGLHWLTDTQYHADPMERPSLSSTLARTLLNQSPLHAWHAHPRLNPDHEPVEKKTFDIGKAAHRAVLGRGGDYVAIPEDLLALNGAASTKAAKEFIEQARADGLTPLKADEVAQVEQMAEKTKRKLAQYRVEIDPARTEIAALAEIDGVMCRAMIDYAPENSPYLYDFKTTTDASPDGCIKAVTNYGLDVQAAFYLRVWEAATGEKRKFRFIFSEKEGPKETSVVQLYAAKADEADWMEDAYGKADHTIRTWGQCLASDHWPGYPAQVAVIGAPGWYRDKWEKFGVVEQPEPQKPSAQTLRRAAEFQSPEGMMT